MSWRLSISRTAMAHAVYSNHAHRISNLVYDSMIADTNSPIALRTGQLMASRGRRSVPKAEIASTIRS